MVFACQPIVAENLILVLQILSEGKGFLTNKQSKAVKFQTMLVLFIGKHKLIMEEQFLE